MELAKLVLEYIKALLWPLVFLAMIFILRPYIGELVGIIRRIKSASFAGVKFDWNQEIREAKSISSNMPPISRPPSKEGVPLIPLNEVNSRMIDLGLSPSPSGLDPEHYSRLADQDPNLALAGIRMELEIMSRNLAKGFNVTIDSHDSAAGIFRALLNANAVTIEQFELAQKILRVCNEAIHGAIVSREEAIEVIDIAEVLAQPYISWLSWGFHDNWEPRRIS